MSNRTTCLACDADITKQNSTKRVTMMTEIVVGHGDPMIPHPWGFGLGSLHSDIVIGGQPCSGFVRDEQVMLSISESVICNECGAELTSFQANTSDSNLHDGMSWPADIRGGINLSYLRGTDFGGSGYIIHDKKAVPFSEL